MLKGKINHCDTALETATNSLHTATAEVGNLLEWIRGVDIRDFTREWEPKISHRMKQKPMETYGQHPKLLAS